MEKQKQQKQTNKTDRDTKHTQTEQRNKQNSARNKIISKPTEANKHKTDQVTNIYTTKSRDQQQNRWRNKNNRSKQTNQKETKHTQTDR